MKARIDELNDIKTNKVKRADELLMNLSSNNIPKKIWRIRFQLLTALYGTLIESKKRKIEKAYLIIQVFKKGSYNKDKVRDNYNDLNRLIRCFDPNESILIQENILLGPYNFSQFKGIDLYIGYKNEI